MGRSSRRVVGIPLSVMEFSSEVISLCSIYFNLELDLIIFGVSWVISRSILDLLELHWAYVVLVTTGCPFNRRLFFSYTLLGYPMLFYRVGIG